jgi:hypothetical protein
MSGLLDVEFAKEKVNAVLRQIKLLKTADFPYDEPKTALDLLEALYKRDLTRLDSLDPGGEGFLYSFMYVICPHLGDRVPHYPPLASRVNTLANGCSAFGIDLLADFKSYFSEPERSNLSSEEDFIVKMADVAVDSLAQDLVTSVERHIAVTGPTLPSNAERDRIAKHFISLSPASQANSLADIINAGWQIRLNPTSWEAFDFDEATGRTILNDLVYKTVEVLEYETRVGIASC